MSNLPDFTPLDPATSAGYSGIDLSRLRDRPPPGPGPVEYPRVRMVVETSGRVVTYLIPRAIIVGETGTRRGQAFEARESWRYDTDPDYRFSILPLYVDHEGRRTLYMTVDGEVTWST